MIEEPCVRRLDPFLIPLTLEVNDLSLHHLVLLIELFQQFLALLVEYTSWCLHIAQVFLPQPVESLFDVLLHLLRAAELFDQLHFDFRQ